MAAAEGDYQSSTVLTDREKCVVRWAELVTKNEAKHDRECWEVLKTYFSPQELIELTVIICHFNLMNRLNDTLQLDLETPPPGMSSLKVPPEKLARYARNVLAREP
ncbi:carboxymuconolactone decarboxylase family protein [Nitrospinota bacterium]